jgi:hypothetical protein
MRESLAGAWLTARSLWELCRYDLVLHLFGFRHVVQDHGSTRAKAKSHDHDAETRICEAMKWALSLYWKRALCLQRSIATARVLRSCGLDARVVIGCRPEPFASHAWVEIDGRVVNDSPGYQKLLSVLERI